MRSRILNILNYNIIFRNLDVAPIDYLLQYKHLKNILWKLSLVSIMKFYIGLLINITSTRLDIKEQNR